MNYFRTIAFLFLITSLVHYAAEENIPLLKLESIFFLHHEQDTSEEINYICSGTIVGQEKGQLHLKIYDFYKREFENKFKPCTVKPMTYIIAEHDAQNLLLLSCGLNNDEVLNTKAQIEENLTLITIDNVITHQINITENKYHKSITENKYGEIPRSVYLKLKSYYSDSSLYKIIDNNKTLCKLHVKGDINAILFFYLRHALKPSSTSLTSNAFFFMNILFTLQTKNSRIPYPMICGVTTITE